MDKIITKPMNWYDQVFAEFEGKIVQSAKYDPPFSIRMSTDIEGFPFRVIMEKSIDSINGKKHGFVESKNETKTVLGSKGEVYKVKIQGQSRSCTCPGFSFRGKCKHTEI